MSCLAGHPRSSTALLLPPSSSAWTRSMLTGQRTNKTSRHLMQPLKLKLVLKMCMLDGAAVPCRRLAVYSGPFWGHQMTVFEIIIAVLHCQTEGMLAYVCLCNCDGEFGLCQRTMHAWDTHSKLHARYRPISGCCNIATSTNLQLISQYRVINMIAKIFTRIRSVYQELWARLWKQAPCRNAERFFKKFQAPNPDMDDFQNLTSSSLSTDTSMLKFSWRSIQ